MLGLLNAIVTMATLCGSGSGTRTDDATAARRPGTAYLVHIARPVGSYPVTALMSFRTLAEAEEFAATKRVHGYAVQVEIR